MSYPELLVWRHCQCRAAGDWTVEPKPEADLDEQAQTLRTYEPHEGTFQN